MKALVHIGPPKSGTTSIQAYLRRNREPLAANRIATLPRAEWVRTLAAMFKGKEPGTAWYRARREASGLSFDEFQVESDRRLREKLGELPADTRLLVLSSEGLFSCSSREIERLKTLLDDFCESVEIITYLRRQDFMAISKQKNKVRNGGRIDAVGARHHRNMDYWLQIKKWAATFGLEQIQVRRFPDSAPEKFDLVEQFQSELAARVDGWSGDFKMPEYRNVGWSWQASEFLRIANHQCPDLLSNAKFHRRLVRQIDRGCSGGEKLSITRDLARDIVAIYDESNEIIRQKFFPSEAALFHDDYSRYPETDIELNQQLSVDSAVQLSVELMAGMVENRSDRRDRGNQGKPVGPLRVAVRRMRRMCGI